jgi:hypothetical protein
MGTGKRGVENRDEGWVGAVRELNRGYELVLDSPMNRAVNCDEMHTRWK